MFLSLHNFVQRRDNLSPTPCTRIFVLKHYRPKLQSTMLVLKRKLRTRNLPELLAFRSWKFDQVITEEEKEKNL